MLVVADGGASNWTVEGLDTARYANELAEQIYSKYNSDKKQSLKDILVAAAQSNTVWGSSTAVMVKFDEKDNTKLRTVVLGDSGYILLRPKGETSESE